MHVCLYVCGVSVNYWWHDVTPSPLYHTIATTQSSTAGGEGDTTRIRVLLLIVVQTGKDLIAGRVRMRENASYIFCVCVCCASPEWCWRWFDPISANTRRHKYSETKTCLLCDDVAGLYIYSDTQVWTISRVSCWCAIANDKRASAQNLVSFRIMKISVLVTPSQGTG